MFEQTKGIHDAKRDIFTIDASTGLSLSPFAVKLVNKVRKKKQKLTIAVNKGKSRELETKLAESISSVRTFAQSVSPVSKGFNDFILFQKTSDIVSKYLALFYSQEKYADLYLSYVQRVERRLFAYYSGASLYLGVSPGDNSSISKLDPELGKPPVVHGLKSLFNSIPDELRKTLPAITAT